MINYRYVKQEDLDEIMEVISDVNPESKNESSIIIIDRISKKQLLCVLLDNKIIGFLGWDKRFQNNPEYWYLEQITIHPDYRNQGIGQNFVKHFLDICKQNDIKKVFAYIQNDNSRSLNVFIKVGGIINTELDKNVENQITIEFAFNS